MDPSGCLAPVWVGAIWVKNKISPKSSKNQLRGPLRKRPAQWHSVSGRNGRMARACAFASSWVVCARFASSFSLSARRALAQPLQNSQHECKPRWIYTQRYGSTARIDQQPTWARGSTVSATSPPDQSSGPVRTGGPTTSKSYENWRVPGAGAGPNLDKALGAVRLTGSFGCFRALNTQFSCL